MKDRKHHEIDSIRCLSCGEHIDMTTGVNCDNGPVSGDLSVCIYCGHVATFNNDLCLRELTAEEKKDADANPVVAYAVASITEVRASFKKRH
jgi:hypothetical protein